jgi:hypothetical protein
LIVRFHSEGVLSARFGGVLLTRMCLPMSSQIKHCSCGKIYVVYVDFEDQRWIRLMKFFRKKVGNGGNTLFYHDKWIEVTSLRLAFPRLFCNLYSKNIARS